MVLFNQPPIPGFTGSHSEELVCVTACCDYTIGHSGAELTSGGRCQFLCLKRGHQDIGGLLNCLCHDECRKLILMEQETQHSPSFKTLYGIMKRDLHRPPPECDSKKETHLLYLIGLNQPVLTRNLDVAFTSAPGFLAVNRQRGGDRADCLVFSWLHATSSPVNPPLPCRRPGDCSNPSASGNVL
ncbi:hypothetical protein KIL84_015597 [Mauremys mutica]|uniref:Uncharacterized protein n=1 Tax=Mauremys mutica TaxID=74926 RepID=A0A9D4AS60_9SAUR|nr:hypothetical protein KIL84_015597 [Mauremys mutica]